MPPDLRLGRGDRTRLHALDPWPSWRGGDLQPSSWSLCAHRPRRPCRASRPAVPAAGPGGVAGRSARAGGARGCPPRGAARRIATWLALAAALVAARPLGAGAEEDWLAARLYLERWQLLEDAWFPLRGLDLERRREGALRVSPPVAESRAIRVESRFAERDAPAGAGVDPSWHLLQLTADRSQRWLGGTFGQHVEVLGYGVTDPTGGDPGAAETPRLFRLGLQDRWAALETGLAFDSVTPGLERVAPGARPDQEQAQAWLGARLGRVRVRAIAADSRDNVRDDPRRRWTSRREAGVAVDVATPSGSLLSVTATHGEAVPHAALLPASGAAASGDPREFDSLTAMAYRYGGSRWEGTISTTLTRTAETGGGDGLSVSSDLSGSYRRGRLWVTPVVSLYVAGRGAAGVGSESVTGALSIGLAPLAGPFDLALYGGYGRSRTTDDLWDSRSLDATASLLWNLRRGTPRVTLAFEGGYHRYFDAASEQAGYREAVGQVILTIASF